MRGETAHWHSVSSRYRFLLHPNRQCSSLDMRIALFIPCYVDQLYPNVGIASLALLQSLGHEVEVPRTPRCCGQPLLNSGEIPGALPFMSEFAALLDRYETVVCPSGSCVSMVRNHHPHFAPREDGAASRPAKPGRILELCEFLHDVEQIESFPNSYPHRVVLHQGCHGLRELKLGLCSEQGGSPGSDKVSALLRRVPGLVLETAARPDECCGFGGTFAVAEPEVSCAMGRARISAFESSGADTVTSADMSCLMHLDGLIRRDESALRVVHVAEIFSGIQP